MFRENASTPVVFTPEFQQCWTEVEALHDEQRKDSTPRNFTILGVSGVGKSTFIRKFKEKHTDDKSKAAGCIPIVTFRAPSAPTVKALMQSVNRAFNGPESGSSAELMRRAVHYINHFKVEVLFMDEAHHLIDRGRMKTHAHLGDCWKEFSDQVGCCIGMIGAPRLKLLFDTNNQLRNRWSASFTLRPFSYDSGETALAQFLWTLVKGTALESGQKFLLQTDTITRIQFATDGVPAIVVKLLQSLKKVKESGADLDMNALDQAWKLPGTANLPLHRRPFRKEFNFERLRAIDEPFFPSSFDGDNHADPL